MIIFSSNQVSLRKYTTYDKISFILDIFFFPGFNKETHFYFNGNNQNQFNNNVNHHFSNYNDTYSKKSNFKSHSNNYPASAKRPLVYKDTKIYDV